MTKKKQPTQESPSVFIAKYIEEGLKKSQGISSKVKKIDIEIETDFGKAVIHWVHPFTKVTATVAEGRIIEIDPK